MEIAELLDRFDTVTVLVVGDVILDEYIGGDCARLSPEAPVPIVRVNPLMARSTLGGAANTAANIASLGGTVVLIGVVDGDAAGRRVEELCRSANITFVPIRDGRPTGRKTRVIGHRQQLLRLDYEDTHALSADAELVLLTECRRRLPGISMIVLSDYAKGVVGGTVASTLIADAHATGVEVVVDPRPEHLALYAGCDYITPNWKECLDLLGWHHADPTPERIRAAGAALRERMRCHIILTLGSHGMAIFDRHTDGHVLLPTMAREVFDVSGAGDTVVAALALARSAGADLDTAVRLANRAAGVVVGKFGTATVTRDEMIDHDAPESRLLERASLARLSDRLKAQGRVVVTLNGSFDLLHSGHVHIIEEARRQGDVLIVGLNSDASVRHYKGPGRPIVPELERARMLLALRAVDYVHIFDEPVPMAFLEEVKPHVHVNGSEYGPQCVEAPTVASYGGRVHVVERIDGVSTSNILARVRNVT
jgi:D-beta-D-heptose 7-phosphate kinase / D-beta-D-heptose 1-phosphate adenosyltransferase